MTALRTPQPPHSDEAEQSVLGGLLLDNTALRKVRDLLTPAHFFRSAHRAIYAAIVDTLKAGRPADAVTVADLLKGRGQLEKVGGMAYIGSLALNTPGTANIKRYAEIVAKDSARRELAAKGRLMIECAHNGSDEVVLETVNSVRKELNDLWAADIDPKFAPVWLDEAQTPTHTDYLVKGLIDRGALTLIYGPSGDGKTFFSADLAAHIAKGMAWRGRRVRPALVVYVAAEAGASILRRFCALRDKHQAEEGAGRTPLAILTRGANLLDVADVSALIATLRDLAEDADMPLGLVVFDTLSRSMPGGDENAAEAMTQAVGAADRIRDELGAGCIIVHHSGKDMERGARGHSSLKAAADTVLQVVERVATVEKARDGTAGDRFPFDLEVVDLGKDPDGDPMTTCIVVPTDAAALPARKKAMPAAAAVALQALRESLTDYGEIMGGTSTIPAGVRAVTLEQWRAQFRVRYGSDGDKPRDHEAIKKSFQNGRGHLIKAQIVGLSDPYAWIW